MFEKLLSLFWKKIMPEQISAKDVQIEAEEQKKGWSKIVSEDPYSVKDKLEEAYKKAERGTEEAGDLLYWLGVCRLEIRARRTCWKKKRYNLEEAIRYFEKALDEYPPEAKEKIENTKVALKMARKL